MTASEELISILEMEQLDTKLFRGKTKDIGSRNVFGGQVLAQALYAATSTVPKDRIAHSLHAYFVLPGNKELPIIYEVDTMRDGRSFTTRRVVAIQNGKPIFNLAASFQIKEEGLQHHTEIPKIKMPEELVSYADLIKQLPEKVQKSLGGIFRADSPIEARPVEILNPFNPGVHAPYRHIWFRWKEKLSNNQALQRYLLAYFSDYALLTSSLLPHNVSFFNSDLQMASLDHAMWFHHDFNMNDWLLYAIESPGASNARGFCRGQVFTKEGLLIASVTQEGLIRLRK